MNILLYVMILTLPHCHDLNESDLFLTYVQTAELGKPRNASYINFFYFIDEILVLTHFGKLVSGCKHKMKFYGI